MAAEVKPRARFSEWGYVGLTAVTQRYDAPSTSAGLCGHRASAPSNSDRGLPGASRHAGRSLHETLACLSRALANALTDSCGTFDCALHGALYRSVRSLRLRR
jgi:hypothetical protein